jgi:hypothetical protein
MDLETRKFLQRIVDEPGFRALVEKDPMAQLASMKVPLPTGTVLKPPFKLPSNEEIRALLLLEPNLHHIIKDCHSVISVCGWQSKTSP